MLPINSSLWVLCYENSKKVEASALLHGVREARKGLAGEWALFLRKRRAAYLQAERMVKMAQGGPGNP